MAGKICVPLDGTKYAGQVVPLVAEIAAKSDMSVVLVSVIDPDHLGVTLTAGEGIPQHGDYSTVGSRGTSMANRGAGGATGMVWMPPIGSPQDLSGTEAQSIEEATSQTRDYLSAVVQWLTEKGINASYALGFGDADDEIVDEAVKAEATMIAMTGRSKSFWERGALGSTADRVVNGSPMPVLVFKPLEGSTEAVSVAPKTVVVGLDGSKQAEQGLTPAIELAKAVGAQVALLRVARDDSASRRNEASEYLEAVASRAGVEVATRVRAGDADKEIILCADEFESPLIAVTEHGSRSFGKWFRGSTTDKVIRNSGYPVLVSPVAQD